jgi:hypothetical protein
MSPMNDKNLSRELDLYRWGTVFAVLSLDLTAPYTQQMGLQLPPGESFLVGLRKKILEFRSLEYDANARLSFARSTHDWLRGEHGPMFSQHLYHWGEEVFQYGNSAGASVFLWNNILRRGGLDGSRDIDAPPGLVAILRKKLAPRTAPMVPSTPISTWDREVYFRQGYDELMNPTELIRSTMSYYNFIASWQETSESHATELNLGELQEWAMREARRMGMPIDRLGSPEDWPPLPRPWRSVD